MNPLLQSYRRRLSSDDGISLVEVMVSIVILGTALAAVAGTITANLGVITNDEQFVRGNQIAADLIEESRAQTWKCIGLDSSAPGWSTTSSSGDPMAPMGAGCVQQRVNLPSHDVVADAITYTVTRQIVWIDDSGVPGTENAKFIEVTLDWTSRQRPYTVTHESLRVPTPAEVPVASLSGPAPTPTPTPTACTGQILTMTISPETVAITPSGQTAESIAVVVDTCSGTSGVTLAGDSLSGRSMAASPTGSSTRWVVNFPAGQPNFPAGPKNWTATATGTAPAASRTATRQVTFYQQSSLPPVQITSVAIAPQLCVDTNGSAAGKLHRASVATIVVQNITTAADGTVTLLPPGNPSALNATFVSTTGSSSTWRVTIPAGSNIGASNPALLYTNATRLSDNAEASESQTGAAVEGHKKAEDCS